MNPMPLTAFLSAAILSAGNLLASGWEIKAAMQSSQSGESSVTVFLQDDDLRADFSGTSMLVNLQTGEVTTIMHEQKMFMQVPTSGLEELAKTVNDGVRGRVEEDSVKAEPLTLQPTGRKKTISGFPCEEYNLPSEPNASIWFTSQSPMQKGFLDRLVGLAGVRKSMPDGFDKLDGLPGFPIRVSYGTGEEELEFTILSISEKSFAPSDFAPPSGYQPFKLPPEFSEMMKQLQQQANP
jgi:hypothetical protein